VKSNICNSPSSAGSLADSSGVFHNGSRGVDMATSPEESNDWRQFIVSTPDVLRGKPRIVGTRIPVALILGYLASGAAQHDILAEFSDLRPEHISACLAYARELAEFEVAST
jgi:uncharacterized protein (DUF433 family)